MVDSVQELIERQPALHRRRRLLHPLLRLLLRVLCKIEATGLENFPTSGASILMMNHISLIDPVVFTGLVRDRHVISMAKAETLDTWFSRFMVRSWGNFVVNRDEVDRHALESAIELLHSQEFVLIAPEGTRNPGGLEEAKGGIPYIAHRTNAIIVPAAIVGAQDWNKRLKRLQRAYARVNVGKAFRFRLEEGQRLTRLVRQEMIREAMYQLALAIPDEYASMRGVYRDIENATTRYIEFV
jgi:1-acyl-sn-glycerol-3-phosphate acyltransferase